MTPDFRITTGDTDLTNRLRSRLTKLVLTDNDGFKNDTLMLVLDNRSPALPLPRTGVELSVELGYTDALTFKGGFEVDEVALSSPPATLTIIAKGSKINPALKIRRTHTYEHITIGTLVETIARRSYMLAHVSASLAAVNLVYLKQASQSDQHLLAELAENYDGKYKASAGRLLFYAKDDFKKISGEALKPVVIKPSDCLDWRINMSDRSNYGTVIAKWRNNEAAEIKRLHVGEGEPVYEMKAVFADETDAKTRAQTKYNELLRGKVKGTFTVVGNAAIAGEYEVVLAGFGQTLLETAYKCTEAVHTIDNNGYRTQFKVVNKT